MTSPTTLLLSIPADTDLLPALRAISPSGNAWLQAMGQVESVEVRVAGEGVDPTRALRGRFTLLSLLGPSAGPFTVLLARATDAGLETLGGQLVRARSAGVQVAIFPAVTSASDAIAEPAALSARREVAITTTSSRPVTPNNNPAPPAAPEPSTVQEPTGWTQVAQASEVVTEEAPWDETDDEPNPQANDLVDHFAFGLCEVLMADGERLRIRDLKGPGRIREVSLGKLNVMSPTRSGAKRLFRLLRKNL